MATNKYTTTFYINRFKSIPVQRWTVGDFVDAKGRRCALGHCGGDNDSLMAHTLEELFQRKLGVTVHEVNDGDISIPGKTPRARVLNALNLIRKGKTLPNS